MPPPFRIGQGYDIHRFAAGRPLVLGGVTIPEAPLGLDGHSDADCVSHALADAILAALALPDIGHFFPNTDPRWQGVDSQVILGQAVAEASARGWAIGNVTLSIIAEKPRLAAHVPAMQAALARTLGVNADAVGVQITTNEGLGSLGRGEGIAALAACLLYRPEPGAIPQGP